MDNKNDHQHSDDYIDKILKETESTGDVLDDLTTEPAASTENKTNTASVHEAENSTKTDSASPFIENLPVSDKLKERLEDIKEELFDDYEAERRMKRKRDLYLFYGGKPPEDPKERRKYITVFAIKKFFSIIGTSVFTLFLMMTLTFTIVGMAVAFYLFDFMNTTDTVVLEEFKQSFASYIYEMNQETDEYELVYRVTPQSHDVKLPCDLKGLPDHVKYAFVSIEDERFYAHEGVDFKRTSAAIINLALNQIGVHRAEFGGSTITQQLIKNVTHDDEQTWDRKMREIFKAMKFERTYTKDDILEAYLNEIYFSSIDSYHMYGVEAASIGYFGKPASELTIAEAAVLAAIPKAPNAYNPTTDFEANKERKEICLYKMFELGVISAEQYEEAMNEEILLTTMPSFKSKNPDYMKLTESDESFQNPEVLTWPIETALSEISDYLMEANNLETREEGLTMFNNGGYKLFLTTDRKLQSHLDDTYKDWYYFPESVSTTGEKVQSAIAVLDYKGHILGLEGKIGERTPDDNLGWNIAYEGGRQPGSTIKPVTTYGYAIENGIITPYTCFYDEYLPYGVVPGFDYWPRNYDGAPSGGYYPVEYFLKQSINTLPAQIVYNNGNIAIEQVFDFATRKLHLNLDPEWDKDFAPLCIGATRTGPSVINLANAYMPYGNDGRWYKASIIARCEDVMTGEAIIDNENRTYEQAVSHETAYIMNRMLSKVITAGTGTAAALWNAPLVGKTGTSEDWRDISFVGLTPDYVSAMWVGYDSGTNSWAIEAANSAGIWRSVFGTYADENYSGESFPVCETVDYY